MSRVDVSSKKEFLKWFLRNFEMKSYDALVALEYIYKTPRLLSNVKFVEHAYDYPQALVMTSKCGEGLPLRMFFREAMSSEINHIMEVLQLIDFSEDKLYIQLGFANKRHYKIYRDVLEDGSEDSKMSARKTEGKQLIKEVELQNIYNQIDISLDNRDEAMFELLTNYLSEVLKENEHVN